MWPGVCQSCVTTTFSNLRASWLTSGTISSPCFTSSAPPGQKSFCTSTTIRQSVARGMTLALYGENDLAGVLRRFHQLVRLARVGKRERLVDHRLDLAGLDQRPDTLAQALRDRALELDWPRAQCRARQRQASAHDGVDVELGLRPTQERNEHEPAFLGEAL